MKIFLFIFSIIFTVKVKAICTPTIESSFDNRDYQLGEEISIKVTVTNNCSKDFVTDMRILHINENGKKTLLLDQVPYFLPIKAHEVFIDTYLLKVGKETGAGVHKIFTKLVDFYSAEYIDEKEKVILINTKAALNFKFIKVTAGKFMMGSPSKERYRKTDENIAEVTISNEYMFQTKEVTQLHWFIVTGKNPAHYRLQKYCPDTFVKINSIDLCPYLPIENVKWWEVKSFIQKLGKIKKDETYRLPSEAEWEFATRMGRSTPFVFGDNYSVLKEYSWYQTNSKGRTHRIGTKKPSNNGLFDIHGNVSEWVQNWYSKKNRAGDNPFGPLIGLGKVFKGGSFNSWARSCRLANKDSEFFFKAKKDIGFRLVKSLNE